MKRCSTRELIMINTLELLQNKSIVDLRVEEIVNESAISKRTFYMYFKDKHDVVCAIYDQCLDYCWGVNDTRQNLQGYIERAAKIWESTGKYSTFMKNTILYDGQNSLSEHIVMRGVFGIERLLSWNSREDLLTPENKFIIEFWMRGLDSMSRRKNTIVFNTVGIEMYKLFPKELLEVILTTPPTPST